MFIKKWPKFKAAGAQRSGLMTMALTMMAIWLAEIKSQQEDNLKKVGQDAEAKTGRPTDCGQTDKKLMQSA